MTTKASPLIIDTGNITSVGSLTSLTVTGSTNLGAVSNVHITGGTTGQLLSTDGSGNLNWSTVASGSSNATIRAQAMTMGIIFGG